MPFAQDLDGQPGRSLVPRAVPASSSGRFDLSPPCSIDISLNLPNARRRRIKQEGVNPHSKQFNRGGLLGSSHPGGLQDNQSLSQFHFAPTCRAFSFPPLSLDGHGSTPFYTLAHAPRCTPLRVRTWAPQPFNDEPDPYTSVRAQSRPFPPSYPCRERPSSPPPLDAPLCSR